MKEKIAQIVLALAEYYDKTLSENQIAMYVEDLLELSPDQLMIAVKKYRNDPKNVFFPLPAQLKAAAKPALDDKDLANELANKVIYAIGQCGWNRPQYAKIILGELGWEITERAGGWLHICESINTGNEGVWKAQLRDLALVVLKRAARGELKKSTIEIEGNIQKLISDTMKGIEK